MSKKNVSFVQARTYNHNLTLITREIVVNMKLMTVEKFVPFSKLNIIQYQDKESVLDNVLTQLQSLTYIQDGRVE